MTQQNIKYDQEYGIGAGAIFSPDEKYRYSLHRIWDLSLPMVMFIGLNPSTANQTTDDPTIRRVKRFAKEWGYGGVYMCNLFGIVSAYPEVLKTADDPVGDNDKWLTEMAGKCERIVFAWGSFKETESRTEHVISMFPDAYALIINQNGSPRHPLYVPANTVPMKFST